MKQENIEKHIASGDWRYVGMPFNNPKYAIYEKGKRSYWIQRDRPGGKIIEFSWSRKPTDKEMNEKISELFEFQKVCPEASDTEMGKIVRFLKSRES